MKNISKKYSALMLALVIFIFTLPASAVDPATLVIPSADGQSSTIIGPNSYKVVPTPAPSTQPMEYVTSTPKPAATIDTAPAPAPAPANNNPPPATSDQSQAAAGKTQPAPDQNNPNPTPNNNSGSVTDPAGQCEPDRESACTQPETRGVCSASGPVITYPTPPPVAVPGAIVVPQSEQAVDVNAAMTAQKWCLSDCSPVISTAVPILQGGLALITTMRSANSLCGTVGDLLIGTQAAMTAFDAACTTQRLRCNSTLKKDMAAVQHAIEANNGILHTMQAQATIDTTAQAQINTLQLYIKRLGLLEGQLKTADDTCSSYMKTVAGGIAGIVSIVETTSKEHSCQNNLSGSSTAAGNVDCTLSYNANTQACICLASPNASGCTNGVPTGDPATGIIATNGGSTNSGGVTSTGTTTTGLGDGTVTPVSGQGGTAVNQTNGAGSAGGLAGSSSTKASDKSEVAGTGPTTGNKGAAVLSEGSGSGGDAGGGAGANPENSANAYSAFMPGGANYVNARNPATVSKTAITGAAGADNFSKTNNAYIKQAPSLSDGNK